MVTLASLVSNALPVTDTQVGKPSPADLPAVSVIRQEQHDGSTDHHPATTILSKEGLFNFCTFEYIENFSTFITRVENMVINTLDDPAIKVQSGRDDLMYTTAIPWVSFTKFMHPMHFHPADSVPRFAWGKFFEAGELLMMPLDVQAHHALMDGLHMGRFFEKVQSYLHNPGSLLGEAS